MAGFPHTELENLPAGIGGFLSDELCIRWFMLCLWYFVAPQGLLIKNSVVYFDVSPLFLLCATVACYFAIRLVQRITGRQRPEALFCPITIQRGGQESRCTAKSGHGKYPDRTVFRLSGGRGAGRGGPGGGSSAAGTDSFPPGALWSGRGWGRPFRIPAGKAGDLRRQTGYRDERRLYRGEPRAAFQWGVPGVASSGPIVLNPPFV